MLHQNANEALIRSEDRAVEHDRAMLVAILADIARVEPLGQHAVRLDGAHLPGPPDRIGQMPFELGRVEGAFAGQFFPAVIGIGHPRFGDRIAQFLLGLVPQLLAAEPHLGPQRQLDVIAEAEILVDAVGQLTEFLDLADHLILGTEDMRIVLGELAHAHQSVERAMRFVAMAAAHFAQPDRQVAIACDALFEDENVRRAVHRLQRHPLGFVRDQRALVLGIGHLVGDDEHVLAIFAPVARLFPLAGVHHLRGLDLAIAAAVHLAAHIRFQLAPDAIALGMPENAAMRFFLQVEQVHLAPQLAVVALGGLFQPVEMRVELLLVEPAGAIDARKLRILLVAAPVCARHPHQLEGLRVELAGAGQMGAAAHVEPVLAAPIHRQVLALGQFGGPFGLEAFALRLPARDQILAAPHLSAQRLVGLYDPPHLLFDCGQVIHAERLATLGRHHVIIEPVVGRRAEGDLRARPQRLHRLCQHMGIVVARQFERIGLVPRSDQRQLRITLERAGQVAQLTIHTRGQRCLGKAGADRRGDIRRGRSRGHFAHRSIGEADLEKFRHRFHACPCRGGAMAQAGARRKWGVANWVNRFSGSQRRAARNRATELRVRARATAPGRTGWW